MGMADIATVLFKDFMQFDAADPHWIDRDRFVLSNGHGSMLLYSLLFLTGYCRSRSCRIFVRSEARRRATLNIDMQTVLN
jgi:transketolase